MMKQPALWRVTLACTHYNKLLIDAISLAIGCKETFTYITHDCHFGRRCECTFKFKTSEEACAALEVFDILGVTSIYNEDGQVITPFAHAYVWLMQI